MEGGGTFHVYTLYIDSVPVKLWICEDIFQHNFKCLYLPVPLRMRYVTIHQREANRHNIDKYFRFNGQS